MNQSRPYKGKFNICIYENGKNGIPVVVCTNIMELAVWMLGVEPGKEDLRAIRLRVGQAVRNRGSIIIDRKRYKVQLIRV